MWYNTTRRKTFATKTADTTGKHKGEDMKKPTMTLSAVLCAGALFGATDEIGMAVARTFADKTAVITGAASVLTTAVTTVMINARHLFYSISMIYSSYSISKCLRSCYLSLTFSKI